MVVPFTNIRVSFQLRETPPARPAGGVENLNGPARRARAAQS